ncbi:DUF799 domain-containing protein [Paraburkholderia strydomiana]|uniref:DUF799 domain-containing protein n=1 Tax=Paraburkholderia strydomiana TaxID=1245417 RepID=UPI0038BACE33
MRRFLSFRLWFALSTFTLLAACAQPVKHADYTAFRNSRPHSILVLPPENETTDVQATNSMLSQMTMPLAESGYYVVPVAVMDETFRQNGLTVPADIQATSPAKLGEIFGADAALYSKITQYGTVYHIVDSATVVTTSAKLVDLKTGDVLWQGSASANSNEGSNYGGGGLIDMLVTAAVKQIANSLTDKGHDIAGVTSYRLLHAGPPNGLLYGPRSPKSGTD